nr:uncharacterized protein LOC117991469 [Maniola hyperantus]
MSDSYQLECGVRQGGLTSPTLFNLYMDELIVALSKQRVGCHVDGVCVNNLSYADDMVLLSASICGLRRLVQTYEEYAGRHGLKYNVTKSKCMVFEAAGTKRPQNVPPVLLSGVSLDTVDQFRYLGHVITTDLKDDADVERERRALSIRANMIAHTKKRYSDLRVLYNNAFRMLMGLPRFCSASGMFADARIDCFYTTVRKRCASLVRRVRDSPNTILQMVAARLDCPYLRHCCERHVPVPMPERRY